MEEIISKYFGSDNVFFRNFRISLKFFSVVKCD
jgi:hypothetical protein